MYAAFLAICAGLCNGMCGVGYRIAASGKTAPMQCAVVASIFGSVIFGFRAHAEWANASWGMCFAGAVFGLTQYWSIRGFRWAMKLGPFSPAWCAMSLSFLPAIIYAGIFLGETLDVWKYASILATVAAIVFAGASGNGGSTACGSTARRIVYIATLLMILVSAGTINAGLKFCTVYTEAGYSQPMQSAGGNVIMTWVYVFMGLGCAADLTITRRWQSTRLGWIGSLIMGVGAVSTFSLLVKILDAPAVIVFALTLSVALLSATVISTLFFHEKRTVFWYLTVGFSFAAIVFNVL